MRRRFVDACIVAVPESAGSGIYGMLDVLSATANLDRPPSAENSGHVSIRPIIVSENLRPFKCFNGVPVCPDADIDQDLRPDIVILTELWMGPERHLRGRYQRLMDWIRQMYAEGAAIYTACSGSVMLAETGLLDGRQAASHWCYVDIFKKIYPEVNFKPEGNLVFADLSGRIVTAGGATSWHDLALHIIARHCSPAEALKVAKFYLLKRHDEGQLPYTDLAQTAPHADAVVQSCQNRLNESYRAQNPIKSMLGVVKVPERTLKRRFKSATGVTLMDYVQALRIEEAKSRLELENDSIDEICVAVGDEDPAFFRRLFRRLTGVTPSQYRRMFKTIAN